MNCEETHTRETNLPRLQELDNQWLMNLRLFPRRYPERIVRLSCLCRHGAPPFRRFPEMTRVLVAPHIPEHGEPFVKGQPERVEAMYLIHDAEVTRFDFFDIGAKNLVPDHQNSGVVAVNVLRVPRVVNAMYRWRVDDMINPAQLAHGLGMNPELICQIDADNDQYGFWLEADPGHR